MKSAADYFLFRFNEKKIRKQIEIAISNLDKRKSIKIKFTLSKWGEINIIVSEISKANKGISPLLFHRIKLFPLTNSDTLKQQIENYMTMSIYILVQKDFMK